MNSSDNSTFDSEFGHELSWLKDFLARDASTHGWDHADFQSSNDLDGRIEHLRTIIECLDERRAVETHDEALDGEPVASDSEDVLRGRRLAHFEVQQLLGIGGCGIVFRALDVRLGRQVAIKIPRPHVLMNEQARQAFLTEAGALAHLNHPYLATIYEAGHCGPIYYMATELCSGPTLAEWLKSRTGPVPPRLAAELVVMLCEAVQCVHQAGILHRDIKPSNILLQPLTNDLPSRTFAAASSFGYRPRLTDFGLAYFFQGESTPADPIVGTPSYMAPEQARGDGSKISVATDVYGLGGVLYHLLVGKPPYVGKDDNETRRLAMDAQLTPLE